MGATSKTNYVDLVKTQNRKRIERAAFTSPMSVKITESDSESAIRGVLRQCYGGDRFQFTTNLQKDKIAFQNAIGMLGKTFGIDVTTSSAQNLLKKVTDVDSLVRAIDVLKNSKGREVASKKYYILVEWVPGDNKWSMEFGDYDRKTVVEEMVNHKDSGSKTKNMRVVALPDDGQKSIDNYMQNLNKEEPNGPVK